MNVVFWNNDFWGDIYGNILAAVVAFLIYWLGNRYQKKKEKRADRERLRETKDYVNSVIPELCTVIQEQVDYLKKISQQLGEQKEGHYNYDVKVALHSNRIKWINHNDLFKAYVSNDKETRVKDLKLLSDFLSKLDYIDGVAPSLKALLQEYFFKHHREYMVHYNANATMVSHYKDELIKDYEAMKAADHLYKPTDFFRRVNKIFYEWSLLPDKREQYVSKPNLLEPLQDVCNKNLSAFRSIDMLKSVNQCLLTIENIKVLKEQIKELIDYMHSTLDSTIKEFKYFIEYHSKK